MKLQLRLARFGLHLWAQRAHERLLWVSLGLYTYDMGAGLFLRLTLALLTLEVGAMAFYTRDW